MFKFLLFSLLRTQFPLRLAYSLTFNKSQGQTLDKVVMDLRSPVFSHGLLYVGNSRVRSSEDLLYLLKPNDIVDGVPTTTNVVYRQLLLNLLVNVATTEVSTPTADAIFSRFVPFETSSS